jgi:hypothetical protein
VWFVFGVQSSARRTVSGGAEGAEEAADGDGATDGAPEVEGSALGDDWSDEVGPTDAPGADGEAVDAGDAAGEAGVMPLWVGPRAPLHAPKPTADTATNATNDLVAPRRMKVTLTVFDSPPMTRKRRSGKRGTAASRLGLLPSLVLARSGSAGQWRRPEGRFHTLSARALPGGVLQLWRDCRGS